MKLYKKLIVFIALSCCTVGTLYAQKETEVFIPVGKSPGVSGKYSIIGKVESVNAHDSVITVAQDTNIKTLNINFHTQIYLDKSKVKQTNTKGSFTDIKQGQLIEVKYKDNKPGNSVEWLKVQIE